MEPKTETPVTSTTSGNSATTPVAQKPAKTKSRLKATIGFAVAIGLVAWFAHLGLHAYHYVETEDAYVTGHLYQISPQISGQVKEILIEENQTVQAGDILVRLDPREFEIAAQKAKASLEQAHAQEAVSRAAAANADAQVAQAEARVTQAEAQVAQAAAQMDLAKLTLTRTQQLFTNGGATTQAELDNAQGQFNAVNAAHAAGQANLTAARAGVVAALAAQNSARSQITAASSSILAAEAAVRDTERVQGYTSITAPSAGRAGKKSVEIGNRVVAGQTLFSLAAPEMWVVANFKETQLAHMQKGQEVELTIDAIPGHTLHGVVESISPASGAQFALLPPDNATGNFNKVVQRVPVKITLDSASLRELGDRLRLGLSVVVNVRVR